jgi:hypothetical protein
MSQQIVALVTQALASPVKYGVPIEPLARLVLLKKGLIQ